MPISAPIGRGILSRRSSRSANADRAMATITVISIASSSVTQLLEQQPQHEQAGGQQDRPVGDGPLALLGITYAEQDEVGLALAAQDRGVDLDAVDPARLGQHARLRLDLRGGQHAAAGGEARARWPAARGSG